MQFLSDHSFSSYFLFSLFCVFQLKLNAATRCFDITKHENEIVLVSFFS